MTQAVNQTELLDLGKTLMRLRTSMGADHFKKVFKEMSFMDYEILSSLGHRLNLHTADKVYLSEVSKELDIPMQRVSPMVKNLQEKGLVYWTHDNTGKGTYIKLSELGREKMEAQQNILITFFSSVIDRVGVEEFTKSVKRMEALEEVMIEESERI